MQLNTRDVSKVVAQKNYSRVLAGCKTSTTLEECVKTSTKSHLWTA